MGAVVALVVGIVTAVVVTRKPMVPVPDLSDCAGVVRVVAEERISDEDADRVAAGLDECLEPISEVAFKQYASGQPRDPDPGGFGRPKVTAMFKALAEDEARQDKLRASFVAWSMQQLATFWSGPPLHWADGYDEVKPVAVVISSAGTAVNAVEPGKGQAFVDGTIDAIELEMATRVAVEAGQPLTGPADVDRVLASRFPPNTRPDGTVPAQPETPLRNLRALATRETERYREDSWWA